MIVRRVQARCGGPPLTNSTKCSSSGVAEKVYLVCRRRKFTHQQSLVLAGTETLVRRGRRCEIDLQIGLEHTTHTSLVEALVAGLTVTEYVRASTTGLSHDEVLAVIRAGIAAQHLTVDVACAEWCDAAAHPIDTGLYAAARRSTRVAHSEALDLHARIPVTCGAGYARARDAGDTHEQAIGGLVEFGNHYPAVRACATGAETRAAFATFEPMQLTWWYEPLRAAGASHDETMWAHDRYRDPALRMRYQQLRSAGVDDAESIEVLAEYPADVYLPVRVGGATHAEACAVADIRTGIGPLAANRCVRLREMPLDHEAALVLAQMAPTQVSGYLKARRVGIEHRVCMDLAAARGSLARFGELQRTGTVFGEAWSASVDRAEGNG